MKIKLASGCGKVGALSLLSSSVLAYYAVSESVEQTLQLDDLAFQLRAYVGVGNEHAPVRHLNDVGGAADVETFLYGVGSTCEGLMLNKLEAAAVIDKGVAGNTSFLMISLRETTVYNHKLAVGLDRILAIAYVHRHMTFDDVTVGARNLESIHNVVYNLLVVAQLEVVAFLLVVRSLVGRSEERR